MGKSVAANRSPPPPPRREYPQTWQGPRAKCLAIWHGCAQVRLGRWAGPGPTFPAHLGMQLLPSGRWIRSAEAASAVFEHTLPSYRNGLFSPNSMMVASWPSELAKAPPSWRSVQSRCKSLESREVTQPPVGLEKPQRRLRRALPSLAVLSNKQVIH